MTEQGPSEETCNPWTIVNVVFHYLADQGLHPTFGGTGHPGEPAAELLRALGITPAAEGDARIQVDVRKQLSELRATMLDESRER
jgi:hypothetical protein